MVESARSGFLHKRRRPGNEDGADVSANRRGSSGKRQTSARLRRRPHNPRGRFFSQQRSRGDAVLLEVNGPTLELSFADIPGRLSAPEPQRTFTVARRKIGLRLEPAIKNDSDAGRKHVERSRRDGCADKEEGRLECSTVLKPHLRGK